MKKDELRHSDIPDINNEFKSSDNISGPNDKQGSWLKKIKSVFGGITVEPILFFYIFSNTISIFATQTLNTEKVCRVDLNYTKQQCNEDDANITSEVFKALDDIKTWQEPLESAVPVIALLFFGAWSDRSGRRKVFILIPLFGRMISSFGLVVTTFFYKEFSLFINALIISLPIAFSGGYYMAIIGCYSYLADVTSLDSRTFRTGIAGVFASLGAPPAIYVYEILADKVGFLGIFSINTVVYMIGVLYTYFRIYDEKPVKLGGSWWKKVMKFLDPSNAWDTLVMPFESDPHRTKILLLIAVYVVIIGPVSGEGQLLYEYMANNFDMNYEDIVLLVNYSIQICTCGTLLAMLFFSKYLKIHDAILGIVAVTSKVTSCFVYAFASTKLWVYCAAFVDLFGNSGVTVVKSLSTKLVAPDQIAKMGCLIGLIEVVTPVMFTSIYSKMYKNTKEILPGGYYLLGAVMLIPALFIFVILYIQCKKAERDRVKDPETKHLHAYENYVTKF